MDASVRLDHSLLALEGEHEIHAMLELAAPEAPAPEARAPVALALVLDVSGSMTGPKLETAPGVRAAARLAARGRRPGRARHVRRCSWRSRDERPRTGSARRRSASAPTSTRTS